MSTTIALNESLIRYTVTPVQNRINVYASQATCHRIGFALAELEAMKVSALEISKDTIRLGRQDPKRGLIWTIAVLHEADNFVCVKDMKRWDGEKWAYDTSLNITNGLAKKEFPNLLPNEHKFMAIPKHLIMALLSMGREIHVVGDPKQAETLVNEGIAMAKAYMNPNNNESSLSAETDAHFFEQHIEATTAHSHCSCGSFLRKDGGCTKCEKKHEQN